VGAECTFLVKGEQARENFIIREICCPAVSSEDSFIQFAVREVEPGGSFVVKVRECAFRELLKSQVSSPNVNTHLNLRLETKTLRLSFGDYATVIS
jgi:hypothetical protein